MNHNIKTLAKGKLLSCVPDFSHISMKREGTGRLFITRLNLAHHQVESGVMMVATKRQNGNIES